MTINKVANPNVIHEDRLTPGDKIALLLTNKIGTVGFFIIIACWTIAWLLWNTVAPSAFRFDPSPTFQIWLFISNLIQILLMPLIMVGQNLQGRHSEIRAENDYDVNRKAEAEIMELNKKLDLLIQRVNEQHQLLTQMKN